MQTISFSDACDNLKNVLDRVAHDKSTTRITRRNGEDAVVMSLDTYNSLMETLHLLKHPPTPRTCSAPSPSTTAALRTRRT